MAKVRIDVRPFFLNKGTGVEHFRCVSPIVSDERSVPIVLKRFDCTHSELADSVSEMNQRLSEGLAQTRVDHPNSCKLFDMYVDITPEFKISVSHVLEVFDKDVNQAIDERKKVDRHYTEAELRTFLVHTAQALAYAHCKGIAHRDIKPANIFQTAAGEYKVGGFGAFWENKRLWDQEMRSYTESGMGTPVFMGPQMKQVCMGLGGQYHAFKNDVYALAASALHLAALSPPLYLKEVQRLDEVVAQEVARLHLSDQLATLLCDMLSMAEDRRPTMEVVLQTLSSPVKIAPAVQREEVKAAPSAIVSLQLALLTQDEVRLFNFQSLSWGAPVALATRNQSYDYSSYTVIEADRLLCCGGAGAIHTDNQAYLVEIRADQCPVTRLPNMNHPRMLPGVIHCEGATYVFGSGLCK